MKYKKNLLSLNTYHYRRGGSDAVFFEHNTMFKKMGWETAVMTMQHPKNLPSEWESFFVEEMEFGHKYPLWKKAAMASKVIYSLEAKRKLSALIEQFKPTVAHAHCIYHHLSPSVLPLLHKKGIPVILTAHDLKLACPAYKMFNSNGICEKCKNKNILHAVSNRCIHNSLLLSTLIAFESSIHNLIGIYKKNVDRVVAPSIFFYNKFIEWGWDTSKIVYIPNFIDTNQYRPNLTQGQYFLYAGRLVREKGVATLIRAIEQTGGKLCIAGSGPDEAYLKSLVRKKNSHVNFFGFISGEKLKNVIQNAKAVVMPSELYENAPISILEAYASGKPVIGSRIGGIPEMIQEGKTGYLFEMGNVEELAGILARLDKAPDQHIQEMGYCSHQYVTAEYSKKRYIDSMLSLYQAVGVNV